jgi:hypothetical protein
MALLKQSTAYTRMFLMVDSTDHFTGKTGLTVAVTLSKAGAAFGAAGGTVTEISSGWYKIALTTTDTNTLGELAYHCTSTGADATDFVDQVSVRIGDDLAFPATSGRSMVVDAAGLVDANTVKVGPSGSGSAQTARDVGLSVLVSSGTGTGQLDVTAGVVKANTTQLAAQTVTAGAGVTFPSSVASPTNITAGTITTVTNLTNAPTAGDLTAAMKTSVENSVWDAARTSHVTAGTFGQMLRALGVRTGTATAGAATSITLDAGASAIDNTYKGALITILSGTGAGQTQFIYLYTGATKVALVDPGWATTPDNTSVFAILPYSFVIASAVGSVVDPGGIDSGVLSAAALNEIADAILDRNMATGTDSGTEIIRTVRQALRPLRNKTDVPNGKVKKEDDVTDSWTFSATTAAGNPITVIDPT